MNYVRVFSGKVAKDVQLIDTRTGKTMRIANLFSVRGKDLQNTDELVAGDIGVDHQARRSAHRRLVDQRRSKR